jgi:S1-C subfamily serine protease
MTKRFFLVIAVGLLTVSLSSCSQGFKLGGNLSGGQINQEEWLTKVEEIKAAVVKIEVEGCDYSGTGSGFFIRGWLVTNRHVIEEAKSASYGEHGRKVKIKKWYLSKNDDLALIPQSSAAEGQKVFDLGENDPTPGDLVAAAGFPWGGPEVSSIGRILSENQEGGSASKSFVIETNLDIHPGNSGGPLVDTQGRVVGVMFAIDTATNSSLAVPLSRLVANIGTGQKDFVNPNNC